MNNVFNVCLILAMIGLLIMVGFELYDRIYAEDGFYTFTDENYGLRCAVADIKGKQIMDCVYIGEE